MPISDIEAQEIRKEFEDKKKRQMDNKHIRVILIGPDCGGKTNIAEGLRRTYGVPGVGRRKIGLPLVAIHSVIGTLMNEIANGGFVMDQWQYPVDIVYEYCMHQSLSPIVAIEEYLVPELNHLNVLFLHVTASDEAIASRFAKRGDELWNLQQILNVSKAYKHYLERAEFFHRTIDTTFLSPEKSIEIAAALVDDFYADRLKEETV